MTPADAEKRIKVEYPDEAGYPDGEGFLDEGTAGRDNDTDEKNAGEDRADDQEDTEEDGADDEVTDFEQQLDEGDEHQATQSS